MKKYYFILATAALTFASCANDEYLGNEKVEQEIQKETAIAFGSNSSAHTRAAGATAANLLGNEFVVEGYKTVGNDKSLVFNDYRVVYADRTAGLTTTNTKGWEYVGKQAGGGQAQTVKYWDYSATSYTFVAYSIAGATDATADAIDYTKVGTASAAYPISNISLGDLNKVYVSDVTVVEKAAYQSDVTLNFRSGATVVRVGFYETIPGYAVKNVCFYNVTGTVQSSTTKTPILYAGTETFISQDSKISVNVKYIAATNGTQATVDYNIGTATKSYDLTFGTYTTVAGEGNNLTSTDYLPTASSAACKTNYLNVIPENVGVLQLKVDYTLESIDNSKETIKVTGATATVPAAYTNWQRNYAYTYIFKISDNTNGTTGGTTDPAGLFPITFDAVVIEADEGVQETITTVAEPSITTYQNGAVVTANNEYQAGTIEVRVMRGLDAKELTKGTNAYLYEVPANSTEADVIHKLQTEKGVTTIDVQGNLAIDDTDNTLGKITAAASKTYAFVYDYTTTATPTYETVTLTAAPGDWDGYYTKTGETYNEVESPAIYDADTTYYVMTNNGRSYAVKVINVVAGE